ncbi:MAG: hypothetical protein ABIR33_17995 [Pyrinomonadaceae bacterium]
MIGTALLAGSSFGQSFLQRAADRQGLSPEAFVKKVCDIHKDPVANRVFRDYGAVFVSAQSVVPPSKCVFPDHEQAGKFQAPLKFARETVSNAEISLQADAMRSLRAAVDEARASRLHITPLDGSVAGSRSYADTVRLWNSRFYRALDHWQGRNRISKFAADAARELPASEQVPLVLGWEQSGLWFNTDFSRSILTSVAAPGTSQHLSGLAFDVVEYRDAKVRAILNRHGWFRTIRTDEPHFTYLGLRESDLPGYGLEKVVHRGNYYWVPKADPIIERRDRSASDSPSREGRQPEPRSPSSP